MFVILLRNSQIHKQKGCNVMVKNAILQKHFEKCGFDENFFETYESTAADELQNIEQLCEALHEMWQKNEKIVIYTDFDVDGIMSSVVAYAGLSELGFNVSLFYPDVSAGYGFRRSDVDNILQFHPTVSAILTGDVGITANDAIEYAHEKGIVVFVTDHHNEKIHCIADVVVNPNQLSETYSQKYICGSYVLYKVLEKYACRYELFSVRTDIYRLRMFAGIATISDVMPLLYENRQLVRDSVDLMRFVFDYNASQVEAYVGHSSMYIRAFRGMKKLLEHFVDIGKIKCSSDIDEKFYGFYLVPMLNSCKRMDGDMQGVYDIFFNEYVHAAVGFDNMACVDNGIKYMTILNERRKELTAFYFNRLLQEKNDGLTEKSVYMQCGVFISDASPGLLGLLASKFKDLSGLPVFVVNENEDGSYTGSGRNPDWLDLSQLLQNNDVNIDCKGHKEAFGVYIPNREVLLQYISLYQLKIETELDNAIASLAEKDVFVQVAHHGCITCDCSSDVTVIKDYLDEMALFHPFGHAFPEPQITFFFSLDSVVDYKSFGALDQHLKAKLDDGVEVMLFDMHFDFEKILYDSKNIENPICVCYGVFQYDCFDSNNITVSLLAKSIELVS